MTVAKEELVPWRETSSDPRALSARAADLVDAARDVPALSPASLARIKAEVIARRSSHAGRALPISLRLALLSAVLLASVATAKGTIMLWRRHVAASAGPATMIRPSVATARTRPRAHTPEPVQVVVPLAPATPIPIPIPIPMSMPTPTPTPTPTVAPAIPAHTGHARRRAMVASSQPRAAESPAPTTTEAQLLTGALSRVRQAHDPAGALSLLDRYDRLFPHGVLRSEALSARLEAVIQMDDRKTALALLDGQGRFVGRLGSQLLVTRAELRVSAGRYADALGDFDRLLAAPGVTTPADIERALYGRAICLGHMGRDDRARVDLAAYQRRFPDGKYASEVARLLQSARRAH